MSLLLLTYKILFKEKILVLDIQDAYTKRFC